jgi:hypothetical protein
MMRVLVAIRTLVERDSCISRLIVWPRCMTLGALNLHVQPGQRIACLRVIELTNADCLPVLKVVALLAGWPKTSAVRVLMASGASRRYPEIGLVKVLDFDHRAFLWTNSRWRMTAIASQSCVLAFEQVSGLLMVERFDVPLDEGEVFAIVFRVAACTLLAGAWRNVVGRMQSRAGIEPLGDFRMAVQALERRLSTELVATGAVGRSIQ